MATLRNNGNRAPRTGSISRNPSGSYRAQVLIPADNGEKTGRETRSFRTKSEAERWLDERISQVTQGLSVNNHRLTMSSYIVQWLEKKRLSLRINTWMDYSDYCRKFIEPYFGRSKVRDIKLRDVNRFYAHLAEKGGTPHRIFYVHRVLHAMLEDALTEGILAFNPAHKTTRPKIEKEEIQAFSEPEVWQFLIAARSSVLEALYHLAVKTGMRQGELLGLTWANVDFQRGEIRVIQQLKRVRQQGQWFAFTALKTKYSRRTIPMGNELQLVLLEHRRKQQEQKLGIGSRWKEHDLLFTSSIGTPIDQRNLIRDFKQTLKQAGLRDIRFHDLRHTAASIMLKNGIPLVDVSRYVGHASPAITLTLYVHLLPGGLEHTAKVMDDLLTPKMVELEPAPSQKQLH
jgi:integrase